MRSDAAPKLETLDVEARGPAIPDRGVSMADRRNSWRRILGPAVLRASERLGPAVRLMQADVAVGRAWMKHRGAVADALGLEVSELYTEVLLLAVASDPSVARVLAWSLPDHLARVEAERRKQYGRLLLQVARQRVDAVPLVMRTLPALLARMDAPSLARFLARALELHAQSSVKAETFLRMESREARATEEGLRTGLPLESVQRTLALYARAHCGEDVQVRALARGQSAFTDGRHLYLPAVIDHFGDERDFLVYRVLTARNAGFIEFGTMDLALETVPWGGDDPPEWGGAYTGGEGRWPEPREGELPLERMLRGFPNPALARDLWTVLENARIEAALRQEYPGIGRDLDQLGQAWRPQRPEFAGLTPAEQVVEAVARVAMGMPVPRAADSATEAAVLRARAAVDSVSVPGADVHATVMALWAAYLPAHRLLARANPDEADRIRAADGDPGRGRDDGSGGGDSGQDGSPDRGERMADGATDADPGGYRGMAEEPTAGRMDVGALSANERAVEVRAQELLAAMSEEEAGAPDARADARRRAREEQSYASMADFLDRMEGPAGPEVSGRAAEAEAPLERARGQSLDADTEGAGESFRYPEWDAAIDDHKPDWVRVTEFVLQPGDGAFVAGVRDTHGPLISQVRRAFEALRPDALRRQRGLVDGDEIDLDRAILERIEARAGAAVDGRIYQRRRRRDRDVAVAFLVDMSSSTNEVVRKGGKRVIEVEKEALVLTAEAVDAIGDACAIWGFSGYGRDEVAFYVAKGFSDSWDDRTCERVGRISWKMENRDGAAIRHATHRMMEWPARVRLLVLLSDGRPLDCGCDHYSDRYAQEDTRMALQEARQAGIHPFCITVDPAGHSYLRRMYGEGAFTVISDVEALPERLTRIYRRLTR